MSSLSIIVPFLTKDFIEGVDVTPPEQIGCFSLAFGLNSQSRTFSLQLQLGQLLVRPHAGDTTGRASRSGEDEEAAKVQGVTVIIAPNATSTRASHLAALADHARIAASGSSMAGSATTW